MKDADGNSNTQTISMSGRCGIFSLSVPFNPVYAGIDLNDKISDAITADTKTVYAPGLVDFVNGKMNVNISAVADSAFLRIEHVYAPPDGFKIPIPGLHISTARYWKVDGIIPAGFSATATINYNGTTSAAGGYLDNDLISNVEDSLVVLYRSSPRYDWSVVTNVTQGFLGSHSDKKGYFIINQLQRGEYALGIFDVTQTDSLVNTSSDSCLFLTVPVSPAHEQGSLEIFSNPAGKGFTVQYQTAGNGNLLEIYNLYGRQMWKENLLQGNGEKKISVSNWESGCYLVKISSAGNAAITKRLIVIN
jgi:hypothetical protein